METFCKQVDVLELQGGIEKIALLYSFNSMRLLVSAEFLTNTYCGRPEKVHKLDYNHVSETNNKLANALYHRLDGRLGYPIRCYMVT